MQRWQLGVACLLAVYMLVSAASADEKPPAQPVGNESKKLAKQPTKAKPLITISKETTFVTEPVGEDGYVDLVAALNQQFSQGVTKENNAAIPLQQIVGPKEIAAKHRERYFRMLGIEPLPEEGDYFVDYDAYVKRVQELAEPGRNVGPYKELSDEEFYDAVIRQFGEMTLWSAADHPVLAAWLAKNDNAFDRVVEATRRPRYYTPIISDDMFMAVLLPEIQRNRALARGLLARALLRAQEGKHDLAQQDLLACHRLARLVGQSPFLIGALVSIAIDGMAYHGEVALVAQGKLTAQQARDYAAALRALSPRPKLADSIDFAERLFYVDFATSIARNGPKLLEELRSYSGESGLLTHPLLLKALQLGVDWNEVLRTGNGWLDRVVAAAREPDYAKQQAAAEEIDHDIQRLCAELNDPIAIALLTLTKGLRAVATHRIGGTLVCLVLPAIDASLKAEHRATVLGDQAQILFAIAAYRADEGRDPKELAALVPKYLDKLPLDTFSGKSFHYTIRPDGWLLYSVGPNGQDDAGSTIEDDPPGDDLVIRVGRK